MQDYNNEEWYLDLQKSLEGFTEDYLKKVSYGKLRQLEASKRGGKTSGRINVESGNLVKAGKVSATKQWEENRKEQLSKCKKGGKSAYENSVGCHSLSKKELSNAGKKGYSKGLGKLTQEDRNKILKNARLASREVNSNLTKEDVIFMRENFIPRHPEFGVVAFSKKYKTSECGIRNAIKGRTFKDVK